MGIAPQGHETAHQDPALDKLPTQEPDPNSWDFVKARIELIPPGDLATLPALLSVYPQYQDQIIRAAQAHMGNAEVDRALNARHIVGKAPTEDLRYLMDDSPPANAEQPAAAPAPSTTPEPVAAPTPAPGVIPEAANAAAFHGTAPDPHDWKNVELLVNSAENANDGALLLKGHPDLREQILDRLAVNLGVDIAAQARQIADAPPGGAAAKPDAEAEKPPAAQAQEQGPTPGDKPAGSTEELRDPELWDPNMPAWVSKALQYNALSDDLSREFDALTGHTCAYQADEIILNPVKVARWQKEHDVPVDGRVGPKTLAAARALHKMVQEHPEEAPLEEQLDELGKA
jgi:hypothetical protein